VYHVKPALEALSSMTDAGDVRVAQEPPVALLAPMLVIV
jgi:hypothetical protein